MKRSITASMLYNLSQCPHRLYLDVHGDPARKDPESGFLRLLWEKGTEYEKTVMESLHVSVSDLSALGDAERERLTTEAIERSEPLIYGGRIRAGDLLGEPDLLQLKDTGYVACDIKSGSGLAEGGECQGGHRPKKHYALQLGLYTDILEHMGRSAGRKAFIWDIHGRKIVYHLDAPAPGTPDTLWQVYRSSLERARRIVGKKEATLPAYSSTCKLCHWNSLCKAALKETGDLTLIPELGRAKRDIMQPRIRTIAQFAGTDPATLILGSKTVFKGISAATLKKYHLRAKLLADPQASPVLKKKPRLPEQEKEVFFDIETDPMRDICYLHGFLERNRSCASSLKYTAFLAQTPDEQGERQAFAQAWAYVHASEPCALYYYSKYEPTVWRRLQRKYPDIMSEKHLKDMFDPRSAVDLYHSVVVPCTEWPTTDHTIKTLARFLGFQWRDESPSGADSIEWYHRWVASGDVSVKRRILEYNEDDCTATQVVLDGIRALCGQ